MSEPPHSLAATCRCIEEDLKQPPAACESGLDDLSGHPVIACFIAKRGSSPTGQEVIQALAPKLMAYSLHCGQHRGATWHHVRLGVVWLLACAIHRDDDPVRDAYVVFQRLQGAGRLLPTREDIAREVARRSRSFAVSLREEIPALRARSEAAPGTIVEGVLGGRVTVRLRYEAGDPPLLSVAISERLIPGEIPVPPEWQVQVLAAAFPDAAFDALSWAGELGSGHPLRTDEVGYCHFAEPS
jgi:hypothetical protein